MFRESHRRAPSLVPFPTVSNLLKWNQIVMDLRSIVNYSIFDKHFRVSTKFSLPETPIRFADCHVSLGAFG